MSKLGVAIVGGTGYGAAELLRWLWAHPKVEITAITARKEVGQLVGMVHPNFWGVTGPLAFEEFRARRIADRADVVFLSLPHGDSALVAAKLLRARKDLRLIDLSADFRLPDATEYRRYYEADHPAPRLLKSFVYGIPEFRREQIRAATRIANPGCFATGVQLALTPLVASDLPLQRFFVAATTGSSGSGATAKPNTHHPTRNESFYAYRPLSHQHEGEILAQWREHRDPAPPLAFIPHSAPFTRGISVTAYALLERPARPGEVEAAFHRAYQDCPFVRFTLEAPNVRVVAGTNYADIQAGVDGAVVFVLVALDNLGKGMASTAVQNMNLSCGFEETLGLGYPGSTP